MGTIWHLPEKILWTIKSFAYKCQGNPHAYLMPEWISVGFGSQPLPLHKQITIIICLPLMISICMNAFSASSRHNTVKETRVLCAFPAPHSKCTEWAIRCGGVNRFLMTPQIEIANTVCLLAPDHMLLQYYAIQLQCSTCTTFKMKGLKITFVLNCTRGWFLL